jgi:hypothetical protein
VIKKSSLTESTIQRIRDHAKCGRLKKCKYDKLRCDGCNGDLDTEEGRDAWTITEDEDEIRGSTLMDNFDFEFYLLSVLKIPRELIEMDE